MEETAIFRTEPLREFPSEDPLCLMSTWLERDASLGASDETYQELFCAMRGT